MLRLLLDNFFRRPFLKKKKLCYSFISNILNHLQFCRNEFGVEMSIDSTNYSLSLDYLDRFAKSHIVGEQNLVQYHLDEKWVLMTKMTKMIAANGSTLFTLDGIQLWLVNFQ